MAVILMTAVATATAAGLFINEKLNRLTYDKDNSIIINSDIEDSGEEADTSNLPSGSNRVNIPEGEARKNKDVFNILLLGTDERTKQFNTNARADAIMLLSLNLKEGTAKLVSLERGVGVPIEGRNIDLLTHTFRYGGAELTLKTVRDCFKVDVDKYVRVNFNIFEQIIDAIGGVDINLTEMECKALNGEVYSNSWTNQKVYPGINHLDGHDTLEYARQRFIDDDWHRIVRQRNVIQAVVNQTKNLTVSEINKVADTVLPLVMTNLDKREIASLILHAPKFLGVKIEQMTIPAQGTFWGATGVDGRKYIGVDFEKNACILQEFFYKDNLID